MGPWFARPLLIAAPLLAACGGLVTDPEADPRNGPNYGVRALERSASLGDLEIRYRVQGFQTDGIVLVHGWASDRSVWKHQWEPLTQAHTVLAIDLPGHGDSDKPAVAYTMDLFAESIAAAMDEAGLARAVLVGHSNGAAAMRQFWRRYPERTLALVSVEGALKNFFPDRATADLAIEPFRRDDYLDYAAQWIDGSLPTTMPEDLRAQVRDTVLATPQHVMVSSFEGASDPHIWGDDPVHVPVLFVMASSPFWTEAYWKYIRRICPDAQIEELENVGHYLMLERPEEFNAILLEFLRVRALLD